MSPMSLSSATILVAVDFDEASRRAVAAAINLARAFGGRVVVLHVVPPTSFPEGTRLLPLDDADPVDLGEYVSARARRLLQDHVASVLVSGIEVRQEARSGHVVESVLQAIEECDAKLLVVGTHGRTGVERLVLGSVAESLLRRAPVPVMIVRGPEPAAAHEHPRTLAGASIVTGAVAGAATGALAGPVGAIAGGAVGSVVGAIAGSVLGREDARNDAHDRELDDAIGVTQGSIGMSAKMKLLNDAALAKTAAVNRPPTNER
jgi:universal stress protein A